MNLTTAEPHGGTLTAVVGPVVGRVLPSSTEATRPAPAKVLVGESAAMLRLADQIDAVARSQANVLITGEGGTGKELVARRIHARSARRDRPFVAVSCAAHTDATLDAELFGASTGQPRPGRFQLADGGVLFLDEVAELSSTAQAKLLRLLEAVSFDARSPRADVRILSTTHRDLRARIAEGRFREDLYYRLKVVQVSVPTLRDRRDDLTLLVGHFLRRMAPRRPLSLSQPAWAALRAYPFPGNVRELENAIHHAATVCQSDVIDLEHLPPEVASDAPKGAVRSHTPTLAEATAAFERDFLLTTLRAVNGVRGLAAARLGISRKNLWEKLRRHGVDRAELDRDRDEQG